MNIPLLPHRQPQRGLGFFDRIEIVLTFPASLQMRVELLLICRIQMIIRFELDQLAGFFMCDLHSYSPCKDSNASLNRSRAVCKREWIVPSLTESISEISEIGNS